VTFNLGRSTVTYTVTDDNDNEVSCSYDVVVEDCEAPTLTCSDVSGVSCGAEDLSTWYNTIAATMADNCSSNGNITLDTLLLTDFSSCGGTIDRVYQFTATDEAGNLTSCIASISTEDNTAPVIFTEAEDLTVDCGDGEASSALLAWLNNQGGAAATDACGEVSWTNNYTGNLSDGCGPNGSVEVTFTATDACGNTATTSATFTRQDTTAPDLTVPQDLVLQCNDPLNEAIINNWLRTAQAIDACDASIMVANDYETAIPTGTCGSTQTLTVAFTATDACGNDSTATATITWEDNMAPDILVEATDLILECGDDNAAAITAWENAHGQAMATDECSDQPLSWSMETAEPDTTCGDANVVVYTFTVTDNCGNESTTQASVIIRDLTPPALTVPEDQQEVCGDIQVTLQDWLDEATATDECSDEVTITHELWNTISGCGGTRTEVYRFLATDACGNETTGFANYELIDNQNPTVTAPEDLILECGDPANDQKIQAWLASATVVDANGCNEVTITHDYPNGLPAVSCDSTAGMTVTFYATDACGNEDPDGDEARIIMSDSQAPIFQNCPADQTVTVDADNCSANVVFSQPVAFDVCTDDLTITQVEGPASGDAFPLGDTEVAFVATDGCGNVSDTCRFTITVIDSATPSIACPSKAVEVCADAGECTWTSDDRILPLYNDNCPDQTITHTIVSADGSIDVTDAAGVISDATAFPLGTTMITYYIEDGAGNIDSCSFDVIVSDCEAPAIVCPENDTVSCIVADVDAWLATTEQALMAQGDACSGPTVVTSQLVNTINACGNTSTEVYAFTVTDQAGNNTVCYASYTTTDEVAPTITTEAEDLTLTCNQGDVIVPSLLEWLEEHGGAAATDGCGLVSWSHDLDFEEALALCGSGQTLEVTFTATDGCGNTSTTSADILFDRNPLLGVTKRVVQINNRTNGAYDVVFEIRATNLGDVPLHDVQLSDDLAEAFASAKNVAFVALSSEEFTVNNAYNGTSDTLLLAGTDVLVPGEQGALQLTIRVEPGPVMSGYRNTALGTALDPSNAEVIDSSANGPIPDVNGNNDPTDNNDPTPVTLGCFVELACPAVPDTIIQATDPGWCQAAVTIPDAEITTCGGVADSLIEYRLVGAGAEGVPTDVWIEGEPQQLSFLPGDTRVEMRGSIPSAPILGYSDTCSFVVRILDKEAPQALCRDLTVSVGASCTYELTPEQLDAGSSDNCTAEQDLIVEISRINGNFGESLILGQNDLLAGSLTIYVRVTDEVGNTSLCTSTITIEDTTAPSISCPEDRIIFAEANFCAGRVPDLMAEVTLDNCAPIDTVLQEPLPGTLFGNSHGDQQRVQLTVVDVHGNVDTCTVLLTLQDTLAPTFLDCPQPDIMVNTLPGMCAAFVNFTRPQAVDNCGVPVTITQTDDSGLSSGDMFPVGTTILTFTATDAAGNETECTRRVIVNDKPGPIVAECPQNQEVTTAPNECGQIITNIAPVFTDNCVNNMSVVYRVLNESNEQVASGLGDASNTWFGKGTSTVEYLARDQPLLLITEVSHAVTDPVSGTVDLPTYASDGTPDGDYLEVTNLGRVTLNVSNLVIERIHDTGADTLILPEGVTIAPGEVLLVHFGMGEDDAEAGFFNVASAKNLTAGESATYMIHFAGVVIDVAVLGTRNPIGEGGLATVGLSDWAGVVNSTYGAAVRTQIWDNNDAGDFLPAEVCAKTTFGSLNPSLPEPVDNGGITSLQGQRPNTGTCSVQVTVMDEQLPVCGEAEEAETFTWNAGDDIAYGECWTSTINVPVSGELADLNIGLNGTASDFGNLDITLISPEGTSIPLASNICGTDGGFQIVLDEQAEQSLIDQCDNLAGGSSLRPVGNLDALINESVQGDWTLQIGHTGALNQSSIQLDSWSLELSTQTAWSQEDVVIENDRNEPVAAFAWSNPYLYDNCPMGTIEVTYTHETLGLLESGLLSNAEWGAVTRFEFPIGVTTIEYTLTDMAGNETTCSFTVTVEDTEPPVVITCPADQQIQLEWGMCQTMPEPPELEAIDNNGAFTVTYSPSLDEPLPIGVTEVVATVTDKAGNETTCRFSITVLEYEPQGTGAPVCKGQINITLGPDCQRTISPGMVLAGSDYGCLDDYELTIFIGEGPNTALLPTSPVVTEAELGKTLTVKVCDPETGDCCWTTLFVQDYHRPFISCPADTAVNCIANIDPELTGRPEILSCVLGEASISYRDELEERGECSDTMAVITRVWTVSDSYGNEVTCEQKISVLGFDLDDIVFPADYDGIEKDVLSCHEVAANPDLTHPDNTGYPTLDSMDGVFGLNYCSASYYYEDEIYNICPGSYEILRYWKVRNYCDPVVRGNNPREHIQLIRVFDTSAPTVACSDTATISLDPFGCTATYEVPAPVASDSCSSTSYTVGSRTGILTQDEDGQYTLSNLEIGEHKITYRVSDECGKNTLCETVLIVTDQIAPVVICDDDLNVTLDNRGYARVDATDVNEGSGDNCALGVLEVRRSVSQECIDGGSYAVDDLVEVDGVYYTRWAPYVEFSCCDLSGPVRIELRASDEAVHPITGQPINNTNICWMDLTIEDKTPVNCVDLPAVTTTCTDPRLDDLSSFGVPDLPFTACGNVMVDLLPADSTLDQCGFGTITRRFQVVKNQGALTEDRSPICEQVITIQPEHDYWVRFPADQSGVCADTVSIRGVTFSENACDLIAISHSDERFTATEDPNACYKVFRTYRVINWCEYNGEAEPVIVSRDWDAYQGTNPSYPDGDDRPGNTDMYVHVKRSIGDGQPDTVYYDNTDNPYDESVAYNNDTYGYWWRVISGSDDPTQEAYYENNGSVWAADFDQTDSDISGNVQGDDTDRRYGSFGYWQYTQHIVVYDTVAPTLTVAGADTFCHTDQLACAADVSVDVTATEDCSTNPEDLTVTIQLDRHNDGILDADVTDQWDGSTWTGRYELGTHRLAIRADDGCGNVSTTEFVFTVLDCKAPAPIVLDGISVELMPAPADSTGASAIVWATDYVASPIYDCTGQDTTELDEEGRRQVTAYSINRVGEPASRDQTSLTVRCAQAGQIIEVEIHAWDEAGNHDFATTYLEVQDNMGACDQAAGEGQIAGTTLTEDGVPVDGVEVMLSGGFDAMYQTNHTGTFSFVGLQEDFDYSVIPHKDTDPTLGVTTFDLILLRRHILAQAQLDSPYKWIAADANKSGTLTTLDMLLLRKLILNVDNELAQNTSWRFVDAEYRFPADATPLTVNLPEVKNINDLVGEEVADFVAVKIGDLNGSAMGGLEPRSSKAYELELEGAPVLRAGETYQIGLKAHGQTPILGAQFTLEWTPALDVLRAEAGLVGEDGFALFSDQRALTLSWDVNGQDAADGNWIQLVVQPDEDMRLADVFRLTSRLTTTEAYDAATEERMAMNLVVGDQEVKPALTLYQNVPNPFLEETRIGFFLPEGGKAQLVIQDALDRTIREIRGEYEAGYNEVRLDRRGLAPGVLYYTLRYEDKTLSKTMILER
jgi:subtilisin-like proprotein convertase family protein